MGDGEVDVCISEKDRLPRVAAGLDGIGRAAAGARPEGEPGGLPVFPENLEPLHRCVEVELYQVALVLEGALVALDDAVAEGLPALGLSNTSTPMMPLKLKTAWPTWPMWSGMLSRASSMISPKGLNIRVNW